MAKNTYFLILILFLISGMGKASEKKALFQSGAYGGVALGLSLMHSKNTERVSRPPSLPIGASAQNSVAFGKKTNRGLGGDLFFGYRAILNSGFLVGLDLALSWDSNKTKYSDNRLFDNSPGVNIQGRFQNPYKFIPGITLGSRFLDRFLSYIKLGAAITEFRGSQTIKYDNVPGLFGALATTSESAQTFRKRKIGFYGSATLEVAVDNHLSTFAVASYEYYGKINKTLQSYYNRPAGRVNTSHEISLKPRCMSFKVGLAYRL